MFTVQGQLLPRTGQRDRSETGIAHGARRASKQAQRVPRPGGQFCHLPLRYVLVQTDAVATRFVLPVSPEDSDDVVVALETARVQEERADLAEAARWLQRAAVAARKQGRPERAGQLSRAAASLSRPSEAAPNEGKFEKHPDAEQVLGEADEFQDETIVESAAKLRESDKAEKSDKDVKKTVLGTGTPIAPLLEARPALPTHASVRVAVRRILGGRIECRPLSEGEKPTSGEEEALLVPMHHQTKLV